MARALRRRAFVTACVIASTCIDVKDGACQEACPVECIYEGGRMMVIQRDECIDFILGAGTRPTLPDRSCPA